MTHHAICPYCKEEQQSLAHIEGDLFFCQYCSESGIVDGRKRITKLTLHQQADGLMGLKMIKCKDFLPDVETKNMRFSIFYLNYDGELHKSGNEFDFYETERFLKLFFHKNGYIPQVGDAICGYTIDSNERKECRFCIIGKGLGIRDANEIQLYVIFFSDWLSKNKY